MAHFVCHLTHLPFLVQVFLKSTDQGAGRAGRLQSLSDGSWKNLIIGWLSSSSHLADCQAGFGRSQAAVSLCAARGYILSVRPSMKPNMASAIDSYAGRSARERRGVPVDKQEGHDENENKRAQGSKHHRHLRKIWKHSNAGSEKGTEIRIEWLNEIKQKNKIVSIFFHNEI